MLITLLCGTTTLAEQLNENLMKMDSSVRIYFKSRLPQTVNEKLNNIVTTANAGLATAQRVLDQLDEEQVQHLAKVESDLRALKTDPRATARNFVEPIRLAIDAVYNEYKENIYKQENNTITAYDSNKAKEALIDTASDLIRRAHDLNITITLDKAPIKTKDEIKTAFEQKSADIPFVGETTDTEGAVRLAAAQKETLINTLTQHLSRMSERKRASREQAKKVKFLTIFQTDFPTIDELSKMSLQDKQARIKDKLQQALQTGFDRLYNLTDLSTDDAYLLSKFIKNLKDSLRDITEYAHAQVAQSSLAVDPTTFDPRNYQNYLQDAGAVSEALLDSAKLFIDQQIALIERAVRKLTDEYKNTETAFAEQSARALGTSLPAPTMVAMERDVREMRASATDKDAELVRAQKELNAARQELEAARGELSAAKATSADLTQHVTDLTNQLQNLQTDQTSLQRERDAALARATDAEGELKTFQAASEPAQKRVTELEAKLLETERKAAELQNTITQLRDAQKAVKRAAGKQ